ncbi:uncharacterized protein LMH87_007811 [Akanthomyces muscarius]|uniref:Uncharacterized protein n=1 Tax=Akanthomyces muscarius TaxID=2231603 RepID=A0A9W8QK01_AKAMU|nr:uncharacterized protein LMH87_007811 [Akanthomyces muscarius]KAJ4159873.1 hypothetical protein LMH87_007811 [Akanthomyces muscarius]
MTIGVHAAVSGAPRDLYAAEEIAFEAVRSRMLAARVQGAWILTTYGSCAKLWSLANPSLSPEEVLIRAVFPRSNARGEPNSYFDLSDHCFEWEKIFGLLRLRRCLTPAFANRLFSDGLVDFVVDPSYATQISDLQYLRPDEDTITAMWPGGSRIVLPHVTVIRAVIWTGSEMKSCWSLTGPRFVPPQSGQYGWTRWQTSEVVRYWSWDHPRR